jgi:hypothetical protein
MAHKPVNLKYSLILMGMFIFKHITKFLRMVSQRYELCIEHEGFRIEKYFSNSISNEDILKVF